MHNYDIYEFNLKNSIYLLYYMYVAKLYLQ